jgi:FlaA1/EpsC-like NDP-sugar epimerase/lipopolysaccharide/colanic/teichoic acid biosynthesis glycosyltransferase
MQVIDAIGPRTGLPRSIEFFISAIALILLSPVVLIAMIAIRLTSGAPIFFRQKRVGLRGEQFVLYKLRTMENRGNGPGITVKGDSRVTPLGKFLRQTKIDEIPTLWNVVNGDMSLVGPRPEVPAYVDLQEAEWQNVLRVRPGLTDPVTLNLRNEGKLLANVAGSPEDFYLRTLVPLKLAGYLEYLSDRTWWSDITIIFQTFLCVFIPSWAPVQWDNEQIDAAIVRAAAGKAHISKAVSISHTWTPTRQWCTHILTRQTQFCLDLVFLCLAFVFTYLLRFDFALRPSDWKSALVQLPYVVTLQFGLLFLTGVYAFIWRYVGIREVKAFILAALYSALPLVLIRMQLPASYQVWRVPLSVIIVDTVMAFGAILGMRVVRRLVYERFERKSKSKSLIGVERKRVLLIGAGRAGVIAADQILGRAVADLEIVGFVDDDMNKQRAVIGGVKVLGTTHDLPELVRDLQIDHVIVSIAQASRNNFRRILDICEEIPIKVRIIPGLATILQGDVKITRIRDVEIEDLLGREPVQLDEKNLLRFLAGKRVMVTGAGGSIGSELTRQIARFRPANLLLVERAEFALFNIEHELRELFPRLSVVPLIADICDLSRMRTILKNQKPDVILHAAAHKHVPMMESNPTEGVKNNVLGTRLLGELAGESGVDVFVLISTDKAVRPTSVMGATKRVAELVIQDLDQRYATKYVAVRFGNVIGSAGSVIPIFRHQIQKGGPVTVTHKEMKRYFMTTPEAAQLVLQAGAMGNGGEIFILDMGEPMSILELAKETITLSGLKPFEDIDIVFTGLRAGEKLFEELDWANEPITKTRHPKIYIGQIAAYDQQRVKTALEKLTLLATEHREMEMCRFLSELLPEANLEFLSRSIQPAEDQVMRQQTVA